MINVDPLSHFPIFIEGICNKNPAGTQSLLLICYSIPWDVAEYSYPAEPPQKRAVTPAGATLSLFLPWELSGTTTENKLMEEMSLKSAEILAKAITSYLQQVKLVVPSETISCTRISYISSSGKFCRKHICMFTFSGCRNTQVHRFWLHVISESVSECSNRCREFLYPCKGCHL